MAEAREKAFSTSLGGRRHCERSEAIHGSAAARPAIGHASSAPVAGPRSACYTTGFGNSSADHFVERWIASLHSQ
jgi:hypothetical protein